MTVGVGCLFLLQTQLLKPQKPVDFYSFEVKDAKGKTVSLEKYRGKASLVVNVASHSEQTEAAYGSLQELHRELGTSHFNVLAFPCGQFGDTEPGTSSYIEAFAKSTYGVTFPFFGKIMATFKGNFESSDCVNLWKRLSFIVENSLIHLPQCLIVPWPRIQSMVFFFLL
uniref:Glutathione peroxidase n=1 Tax=Hippocampus comes TaxID=109280 RepID=A0A3Q2XWA8_HIPCM